MSVSITAQPLRGALMIIAKTPEPGRVKTRLSPPLTPDGACEVAWACLLDTLAVAANVPAQRHVLVLDGTPGPWIPPGFDVIAQRGDGLAGRLAAAFQDVFSSGSTFGLVIAMDTPQLETSVLHEALDTLARRGVAVLGPAADGGFWAIGLQDDLDPVSVFADIPMSTPQTGAFQERRLRTLGCALSLLPVLRDIDDVADLVAVSTLVPQRRIAQVARAVVAKSHFTKEHQCLSCI